jgi:hypothetical protein
MIVNSNNWEGVWKTDFTPYQWVFIKLENELFTHDDRGINIVDKINETHDERFSEGNGVDDGYVKLYKRKVI